MSISSSLFSFSLESCDFYSLRESMVYAQGQRRYLITSVDLSWVPRHLQLTGVGGICIQKTEIHGNPIGSVFNLAVPMINGGRWYVYKENGDA